MIPAIFAALRVRMENPALLAADLNGEYHSLSIELAKQGAYISRLKAELGGEDLLDRPELSGVPLPSAKISEIVGTEAERLKTEQIDYEREKTFLRRAISEEDEQIKVLMAQEAGQSEGTRADAEELRRASELFGKGMLPSMRVTDARRAMLLSSAMKLQTTGQLIQVKRQQAEMARQLERLGDQRQIKLLQELQEASIALSRVRAKLQSTGEKLQYAAARSLVARGDELKPIITVIRKGKEQPGRVAADEDSELQPGDVVEVALRSEYANAMEMRAAADVAASGETRRAAIMARKAPRPGPAPAKSVTASDAGTSFRARAASASERPDTGTGNAAAGMGRWPDYGASR